MSGEQLNNSEATENTNYQLWASAMEQAPPFSSNEIDHQDQTKEDMPESAENLVSTPEYLTEIDDKRRTEIIDTSAEMTAEIPSAVICGGNAQRLLYEAYTGKKMFGVGKNDSDIYVSNANFNTFLIQPPEGYTIKHELDEDGQEKWVKPDEKYLVLTKHGEQIDVFGRGDSHDYTTIEIDGKSIRVQSLTDQIKDKLDLMMKTEGLTTIEKDPIHNPDPASKYGVYAQRLLEVIGAKPDEVNESELPEDWRETLEVMAAQGKYGEPIAPEKEKAFQEKLEAWQAIEKQIRERTAALMAELKLYYESSKNNADDISLPPLVSDYDTEIREALAEADTADNFIAIIISKLSDEQKDMIRKQIKNEVVGNISKDTD